MSISNSSDVVRYQGEVDDSMFDIITNKVELDILNGGTQFELRWEQTWTEDLQHFTTIETVVFVGSVLSVDTSSSRGGGQAANGVAQESAATVRQRLLQVENRPVSSMGSPSLNMFFNMVLKVACAFTTRRLAPEVPLPDMMLTEQTDRSLTLEMRHLTSNNKEREMRLDKDVTVYNLGVRI
jgi:hypothetical protein